jgi:hypothetical protein
MFTHNLVPDSHDQDLVKIYQDENLQQQARAWLFEQEDKTRLTRFLWNVAMTASAIVAAAAAIWLLVAQERRWNSEDRPQLVASYVEIPQQLDRYNWTFSNTGKEDATNIQLTIATVDLTYAHHTLLTKPIEALGRLKPGMIFPVSTPPENDLQLLVVCLTYSNDRGTVFVDPPQFYLTPYYMQENHPTRSAPSPVTGLQHNKLAEGFSCTTLLK